MVRKNARATASTPQPAVQSKASIASSDSNTALNRTMTPSSASTSRKRKLVDFKGDGDTALSYTTPKTKSAPSKALAHLTTPDDDSPASSSKKQKKKQVEKRLRVHRKHAPKSFLEKLERAQTQRMIVISRERDEEDGYPTEEIDIVGSTGNIYRVTINKQPSCTCPDSLKGNECKHKVYALHTVLKAPEHLQYQLALLSSELREIFEGAPAIPTETAEAEDKDGKRKRTDGECPICYMDLDKEENELVWCKAACGNNMHKSCFEQWAASQRGNTVKCVYCRTPWEMEKEDLEKVKKMGSVNSEGYVNVADHFGIPTTRDYSSYHQHWVRRTFGMGW